MIEQGMFGSIVVKVVNDGLYTFINDQCEGGSELHPPAAIIDPELPDDAPGPIPSSRYMLGWLLAGQDHPRGTGVMVGLGSGGGAVQLLAAFPETDLTIVEIDPAMVRAARASYPLIEYYENKGRLQIITEDAERYFKYSPDLWDFSLVDGYTGKSHLVHSYLPDVCSRCSDIYANVIDSSISGPDIQVVAALCRTHGKPLLQAYPCQDGGNSKNIILTSSPTPQEQYASYVPFDNLGHFPRLIRLYDEMIERAAPLDGY